MPKPNQEDEIGARVPHWIKLGVQKLAAQRGQNESVIVRDALREHLEKNGISPAVNLDDLAEETAKVEAVKILYRSAKAGRGIRGAKPARGVHPGSKPKKQRPDSRSR